MNLVRSFLCLSVAIGATVAAGCTTSRTAFPEEWDGLVRQPHPRLNAVFVKPDAEIRGYRNVLLDPLQTSFARNWDPNRVGRSLLTRLDAGDMSAIEDGLAELFHEIFRAELERVKQAAHDKRAAEKERDWQREKQSAMRAKNRMA